MIPTFGQYSKEEPSNGKIRAHVQLGGVLQKARGVASREPYIVSRIPVFIFERPQ
jgi:hypothetical protein